MAFIWDKLVCFRARHGKPARIEMETPHPAFSAGAELEWRAGKDAQSERDVYAPKKSYAATTKVHFGR